MRSVAQGGDFCYAEDGNGVTLTCRKIERMTGGVLVCNRRCRMPRARLRIAGVVRVHGCDLASGTRCCSAGHGGNKALLQGMQEYGLARAKQRVPLQR